MRKYTVYECKHCKERFIKEDWIDAGQDFEEALWGHVQMEHSEVFEELQDLETPCMIDAVYERELYRKLT